MVDEEHRLDSVAIFANIVIFTLYERAALHRDFQQNSVFLDYRIAHPHYDAFIPGTLKQFTIN